MLRQKITTKNKKLMVNVNLFYFTFFRAAAYGDTADECGEAFFLCGKALLELARSVTSNGLQAIIVLYKNNTVSPLELLH